MNQLVPQPMTATRSPGWGSASEKVGRSAAAARQVSGWEASSALTKVSVMGAFRSGSIRVIDDQEA
jgi:hypothetical protein